MNENKIDIILNSAEELMCSSSDTKDITVDMIAKNAGIGKGSIYYYFESKDEIVDAVIERSYTSAIKDFFASINKYSNTFEKIKMLFYSILRREFLDKSKNVISYLHIQADIVLHYKMMVTALKTLSPILTDLLKEGCREGTIHTDTPEESSEMIVAMMTLLLNDSFFAADKESQYRKLKLYAQVLETCLKTEPGSFDFLFEKDDNNTETYYD